MSVGSARRSKVRDGRANSTGPLDEFDDDLLEERLDELLTDLEAGPEPWAWLELRKHSSSKIELHVVSDIRGEPDETLVVQSADGAMARQLVACNKQWLDLAMRSQRTIESQNKQILEMACTQLVVVAEAEVREAAEHSKMMETALETLGPLVPVVLATMAQKAQAHSAEQAAAKVQAEADLVQAQAQKVEAEARRAEASKAPNASPGDQLDAALDALALVAATNPELLTDARRDRLVAVMQTGKVA